MCGCSGNVETFLEPRRHKVGALKLGRMQRTERAKVLGSMLICYRQFMLLLNNWVSAVELLLLVLHNSKLTPATSYRNDDEHVFRSKLPAPSGRSPAPIKLRILFTRRFRCNTCMQWKLKS